MATGRFRLFFNSDIYKTIFTFFSLTSVLVLSIIILFSIDEVPLSANLVNKSLYKVSLLFIVWYGGSIINKNLHISKNSDWISYFIATFLNSFLISLVILRWDYNPKNINFYSEQYYYLLAMFGVQILWLLSLYFFERKMRPYFAKHLLWQSLVLLLSICFLIVIEWNLNRYLVKKLKYDHLETLNLLVILIMPVLFVIFIFAVVKSYSQIVKYASEEKAVGQSIVIWNSFVRIASLSVWVIASITINFQDFVLYDFVFIGILGLCLLVSFIVAVLSLIKKYNRFLVYVFTTNLLIMSFCGFLFVNILNATSSVVFLLFMLYVVFFQFMLITIKPTLYRLYPQLNSLLTYKLMLFILVIWTGNKILGEINLLNISELMWGLTLFLSLTMMISYIVFELLISVKINFSFAKIIKNNRINQLKEKKVAKHG